MKKLIIFILSVTLGFVLAGCADEPASSDYRSFADLAGKKVGVQTGTLYEDYLYEAVPDVEVEFFSDPNTMLVALSEGKLDAYITARSSAAFEQKIYPDLEYLEEPLALIPLSIGIGNNPKKETLQRQMNEFIAESRKNGTFDEMYTYWIKNMDEDNNTCDRSGISGENGKIIVAIEGNYIPFSYINKGLPEGYDVDFAYRFCRLYGYEPVIEPMEFDAISPALFSGKCDLGMNIIYDEERKEEIVFSDNSFTFEIIAGYMKNKKHSFFSLSRVTESFKKTFIRDSRWKQFAEGALVSLLISTSSVICGTLLGLVFYVLCRKGGKVRNKLADSISWLIEGTPVVLLLMIFYFIILGNIHIEKIIVAIITFSVIFMVSFFSMLKSSEKAVGPGQLEAALSQGFSDFDAYFQIVFPQSAIYFLPQYCGEVVSLIKETSIVGYIAILDLTKVSDMIRGRTFEPFFPLISTAIIYFMISWLLTAGVKRLHRMLSPTTRDLNKVFRDIEKNSLFSKKEKL